MYECITGMKGDDISGCLLADEMGLGKTLQCITVIWYIVFFIYLYFYLFIFILFLFFYLLLLL